VDSATAVAEEVEQLLEQHGMGAGDGGGLSVLVTDAAARVRRIAALILQEHETPLELVDLPD